MSRTVPRSGPPSGNTLDRDNGRRDRVRPPRSGNRGIVATGSEQSSGPGKGRPPVIHEGLPTQLPDIDPDETREWLDSFDAMVDERGRSRARYMMLRLLERAREQNVGVPALRSTDYINTIPPER